MNKINSYVLLLMLTSFCLTCGINAQDETEIGCLQMFPEHIEANIEIYEDQLAQGMDSHGDSLSFVLTRGKLWLSGQKIKIAFNGGSYELRKKIMEAALEWTLHANLNFDFGYNPVTQTFYEWKPTDREYASEIRIQFTSSGYWSLVGTDSNNPQIVGQNEASMNLGGFDRGLPTSWKSIVLHEFGHALGFQHEHQHPSLGCNREFRWENEDGYVPTTDSSGQYVPDLNGRRPGIYTVLGGPPNRWPRRKVDHNLRQLQNSSAYIISEFDSNSIMKYYFPSWMFVRGTQSFCFTSAPNQQLSQKDKEGAQRAYPRDADSIEISNKTRLTIFNEIIKSSKLYQKPKAILQKFIDSVPQKKKTEKKENG